MVPSFFYAVKQTKRHTHKKSFWLCNYSLFFCSLLQQIPRELIELREPRGYRIVASETCYFI